MCWLQIHDTNNEVISSISIYSSVRDESEKKTAVIETITCMNVNHPKTHDLYRNLVEVKISDSPSNSLYSCFSTIINLEIKTSRFWKFIRSLFIGVSYAWLTYDWTLKMPNARQLSEKERES
jgi:hypothetical protein